jgi:hypothetical protein
MRFITMFFGPHAPDTQTSRLSIFLSLLQEVRAISKTRNYCKCWIAVCF